MICPGTCHLRDKPHVKVAFFGRTFRAERKGKDYTGYYREELPLPRRGDYLHRVVWAYSYRSSLGAGHSARGRDVHHRDWNTYNNHPLNLLPLTKADHALIHVTGSPDPMIPGCPGPEVCRAMMERKTAEEREATKMRRGGFGATKFRPSNVSVLVDGEILPVKIFCREQGIDTTSFSPKLGGRTLVCVPDERSAVKVRLFSYDQVLSWR